MTSPTDQLLENAIRGDSVALGRLLMLHDQRLRRRIDIRMPADLRGTLAPYGVPPGANAEVYPRIRRLEPRGEQAFYRWLVTIVDHKLLDAAKAARAAKRPPPHRARRISAGRSTSFLGLLDLVDEKGKSPSGVIARREAIRAVQAALDALPEPGRQALWMRHIDGRPVREIAAALGRTEHAVEQLCHRGLARLRKEMGSRSKFLSDSR